MTTSALKKIMAEDIWLNYFNNVLFEKSLITESERNKMKHLIREQTARALKAEVAQ